MLTVCKLTSVICRKVSKYILEIDVNGYGYTVFVCLFVRYILGTHQNILLKVSLRILFSILTCKQSQLI